MGCTVFFWSCILFVSFILISQVESQNDYRLPTIYSPSYYKIDLIFDNNNFDGSSTTFTGKSNVIFKVLEPTSTIKIHGAVTIVTLNLYSENGTTLETVYNYNNVTEILTIDADSNLTVGLNYTLSTTFIANLDLINMNGVYRSEYINEQGTKVYLVTTQFEATYARKGFPCFDEPRYKAIFSINITYPTNLLALGNTPVQMTERVSTESQRTVFVDTPVMSTYLIAFIISDFNCTEGNPIDTGVPHSICSSKQTVGDRALAVEYGPRIMQALENMTGLKYKDHGIAKMEQVALPDFAAGAMENWGLVTYRETSLLWNTVGAPSIYKKSVLAVIAHEFTHMWFGNMVTCDWWDYLFLNEGFARYFQYFTFTKISDLDVDEDWDIAKLFIIEQQQVAFTYDSSKSSKALTAASASPSEVSNKFDTISYNKGACIIRMLENIMGSNNFFTGLNLYLKTNAFSSAVPNKLWTALEPLVPLQMLPNGTSFYNVMENWVNASGFPLVTVSVSANNIILTQERFLYNFSEYDDTKYYIPITYSTSNMSNPFIDVSPTTWLTPTSKVTLNEVLQYNQWFVLNNQQSAYYRVNYDSTLWEKIMEVLQDDHSRIHVTNRAQIVDDAFNLARAGIIDYSQTFSILTYLKHETDYQAWYPAITGFNFLQRIYGEDSETGKKIIKFEGELIDGVLNSVSFSKLNESNLVYSLKLSMILTRACKLGIQSCITSSKELFAAFKNGLSVDRNLKSCVYCNALRYSSNIKSDFEFLWTKFKSERIATEKLMLMSALGCATDKATLKTFLNNTLNPESGIKLQDFSTAWSAVYSAGPNGIDAALEFYLENHEKLYAYYSSPSSLLSNIAARITKTEQLAKLENIAADSNVPSSLKTVITSALSTATSNANWANQRKSQIDGYFNPTTSPTVPAPTTLCTTGTSAQTYPTTEVQTGPTTEKGNSGQVIKSAVIWPVLLLAFSYCSLNILI